MGFYCLAKRMGRLSSNGWLRRCRCDERAGDSVDAHGELVQTRRITPSASGTGYEHTVLGRRGRRVSYDQCRYCGRNVKECRSLATRFEKLAIYYLGMVQLAIIQRYLRLLAPEVATV